MYFKTENIWTHLQLILMHNTLRDSRKLWYVNSNSAIHVYIDEKR